MANLFNHSEIEYRYLSKVRKEHGVFLWEENAPRDLLVNYGFDAMHMTAKFFRADEKFRWKEEYEDQVYGFYLMISRIWEIVAESADAVLDNTVIEQHVYTVTLEPSEAEALMNTLTKEMQTAFQKLHEESRLRDNAVIALLMKYGHKLRRYYHDAGFLTDDLMDLYINEFCVYAPCVGLELKSLRNEGK